MATGFIERRKEPRVPADGELTLYIDDPAPAEVRGRLVDVSRSGFRARHGYPRFEPGQPVRVRHPVSAGRARVMWNRILEDRVETGLLLRAPG
jgi:hypothetical protein